MTRFIVFVFALICCVYANPFPQGYGSSSNDNTNRWPQRPQMPQLPQLPQLPGWQQWPQIQTPKPITPQDIEKMKPAQGGNYHGMAQVMTSHTEWKDGKPVTKTEGQTLYNDNGVVKKENFGNGN